MSEEKKAKLSGAQNRKIANERREKEAKLLKSLGKVDSFFRRIKKEDSDNNSQNQTTVADESGSVLDNSSASVEIESEEKCINAALSVVPSDLASEPLDSRQCGSNFVSDDPAEWTLDDSTIEILLRRGINQNKDINFSNSKRQFGDKTRFLNKSIFSRKLLNGETRSRDYLVYSCSTGSVYCAPCRLFKGKNLAVSNITSIDGLSDWKNISSLLLQHENSQEHNNNELIMLTRRKNLGQPGQLETVFESQVQIRQKYWRNVLTRVFAVVKKLASRGLPFRGHEEKFGSLHNGNYMMTLEVIAEFDPFLADHIQRYGNPGSGKTSYLSSTICDEVIELLGSRLKTKIIDDIKKYKYFSIIVDSTPDIAHVDQLSFVIRYVNERGLPVERFLLFLSNPGHKSEELENAVMSVLDSNSIDIANCRGQSYDNASNMSGVYSGLQARIKERNPKVHYVPCSAHSLNLVGTSAASSCKEACSFFNLVQGVYKFFSVSTKRWEILFSFMEPGSKTIKSLSETRWSARKQACESLNENWHGVINAVTYIANDTCEKSATRCEASGMLSQLNRLETAFMVTFWSDILNRFNSVNEKLQSVEIDIGTVNGHYESLIHFIHSLREMFDYYEGKGMEKSETDYESTYKRTRKRKLQADEDRKGEVQLDGREKFKVETFLTIIDLLNVELEKRKTAYQLIVDTFIIFSQLTKTSPTVIVERAEKLREHYENDLEPSFANECVHFIGYLKAYNIAGNSILQLSEFLRSQNLQSIFPNVDIALRMILCTPGTNCSAERSFSALKRIKNYLRSTMKESRLNSFSLLNIEGDLLTDSYDDLIDEFATLKARRKAF